MKKCNYIKDILCWHNHFSTRRNIIENMHLQRREAALAIDIKLNKPNEAQQRNLFGENLI